MQDLDDVTENPVCCFDVFVQQKSHTEVITIAYRFFLLSPLYAYIYIYICIYTYIYVQALGAHTCLYIHI